jgi:four helix bundle protein
VATVETYRQLEAWQQAMRLVERSYALTRSFPQDERFGLTSQLRRAAVSIPANIAEGACRRSIRMYVNHLSIALGSHAEFDTCVEIAFRLQYLSEASRAELVDISDSTGRLTNGLLRALDAKIRRR